MAESGVDIGTNTQYGKSILRILQFFFYLSFFTIFIIGSALVKVGEAEKKLGYAEHEFVQKVSESFVQPLKSFLDGQMRIIQVNISLFQNFRW